MPTSVRQIIGAVGGAIAAFIAYKIIYALLGAVTNVNLRTIAAGVPGVLIGIAVMYLILRGEKDQP